MSISLNNDGMTYCAHVCDILHSLFSLQNEIDKPVYLNVISFKENLVSILLIFIIDDRSIIETDYVYFYVYFYFNRS